MKVWKKFSAVALALVMVLALGATAFATTTTLDTGDTTLGQQGTFTEKDTPIPQTEKTVTLRKEITAYNPESVTVKAPTINYTYTINSASVVGNESTTFTLTDAANKHNSGQAVTLPVKAGVNPTAVIVAGNTVDDAGTGSGTIGWTNSDDVLSASSSGVANYKGITFNFSNIDFGSAGVYRYVVTEEETTGYTYATSGVTETIVADEAVASGKHTRYIDVYVKDADTQTAGGGASNWVIYGFTCFYNNKTFTDETKLSAAAKTTGFVAGITDTTEGHTIKADSYYTYNVTVSKVVENDSYSATNHPFPFTVIFTNSVINKNVGIITSIAQVDSEDTHAAVATDFVGTDNVIAGTFTGTNNFQGVLKIKHNTKVEYIGIPCGTDVEVYETNDVAGVTYKVETKVDNTAVADDADAAVTAATTAPTTPVAQNSTKNAYESTKATIDTTANTAQTNNHTVAIKNILLNISPTGVTLRYAPYLAMLGAGVVALPLTLRKKEELF